MDNKKKRISQYAATVAFYDLYWEPSVKKIHGRYNHRYVGLPGAEPLDLSKKGSKHVVDLEGSEDK